MRSFISFSVCLLNMAAPCSYFPSSFMGKIHGGYYNNIAICTSEGTMQLVGHRITRKLPSVTLACLPSTMTQQDGPWSFRNLAFARSIPAPELQILHQRVLDVVVYDLKQGALLSSSPHRLFDFPTALPFSPYLLIWGTFCRSEPQIRTLSVDNRLYLMILHMTFSIYN